MELQNLNLTPGGCLTISNSLAQLIQHKHEQEPRYDASAKEYDKTRRQMLLAWPLTCFLGGTAQARGSLSFGPY